MLVPPEREKGLQRDFLHTVKNNSVVRLVKLTGVQPHSPVYTRLQDPPPNLQSNEEWKVFRQVSVSNLFNLQSSAYKLLSSLSPIIFKALRLDLFPLTVTPSGLMPQAERVLMQICCSLFLSQNKIQHVKIGVLY